MLLGAPKEAKQALMETGLWKFDRESKEPATSARRKARQAGKPSSLSILARGTGVDIVQSLGMK